ncbi:MAG: elongation factor G [Deltaproteobacteria bacterium]|nr:elongation factor G [Deltaproteobacteria bacterium]MBI2229008.1 elongation factor G [Deltaproteobacteria bacterium]
MVAAELDKLRNVGILGQGGSGKTSLGEAMLFAAGASQRLGRVQDGTTVLDYEPEEIKHHVSISTAFHSLSWKKHALSLIDTPGYAAFLADAINCMRAFGSAVFVFNPSVGLRVESERLWARANENRISRLIFAAKMDHEQDNAAERIDAMLKTLEAKGVYLQLPIGVEAGFKGVVDLLSMKAYLYEGESGKFAESEIPGDLKSAADEAHQQLLENVSEIDDELLEKYLDGKELSLEEVKKALREGTRQGKLFPILYGSATRQIGIPQLLDAIADYLPAPPEEGEMVGNNPVTGEVEKRPQDPSAPFSAYVFKTISDPFAGKLSVMRVVSGKIASDMTCYVTNKQAKEKIGHMFRLEGKKQDGVKEASAGEIVAAAKLKEVTTGDTLCDERAPIQYDGPARFAPVISFALEPKTKSDEEKVPQGLHRMMEEDQTIELHRDEETRDFILSGMGQQHIEIIVEKLKRKYGAEVVLKAPKVPYKETIRVSASAQGRLKKQTGGRGQYGDTWIKVEPRPHGAGFEFVDEVVGGAIPRNYIPAVEKGVREAMAGGYLAGYPMVDVRVTLYDGSYHDVDSSDMAFKIAGSLGFKNAVEKAKPVLLEPIMNMEVTVPDECMGDVIGDLNSRRGKVLGMDTKGHSQVIKSRVPMAEVLKYAPDLRSITSGRGEFQMEFSHYEEVPPHLSEKVIKEAKARKAAEQEGEHKA